MAIRKPKPRKSIKLPGNSGRVLAPEGAKRPRPTRVKVSPDVLLPGRNVRAQSREAFAAEVAKRRADQENPLNTLLMPDEVAGDYIITRGLMTTLGGQARPLTYDDLKQFQYNVENLRKAAKKAKMLGGITAKQVIDKSWDADRQRAHTEIRMANPTHYKAVTEGGGQGTSLMVGFMTNAGPDSDYTHHNVNVQFLDFGAVVASPTKADKIVDQLVKGRLKFECNCPRFKYFFRYVCTQAEIVAGRQEMGFPKIRNPGVTGVSCKHGLRVMQTIMGSPTFKRYAANVIQKFRDDIGHTEHAERIADQREFEARRQKESYRQRRVQSSEAKAAQRKAQPSYKRMLEKMKDRANAKERARLEKNKTAARAGIERHARELLKLGAINQQQFDQMMAAAKGT